jgi:HAAS domain-containing protein
MGAVQSLRRRRSAADPMNYDEQISSYLRRVRSALRLPRQQRRRAVEEIRNHLNDGAAAHMRDGDDREQAVALAISELGQPATVADEFNNEGAHGSDSTGLGRWLPLLPPLLLFAVATVLLAWSVVWIPNGWTVGERLVQRRYLVAAVTTGALSYGAYFSINRAQSDSAWRWGAWACAVAAFITTMTVPF